MAYVGKTYKFVKAESFREFLESLKIPEEKIQAFLKTSPGEQKLEKNGNEYTLTTTEAVGGARSITFQSGVEFEETLGEKYVSKTTFTVDGNTVTQVLNVAQEDVIITFKRLYSENELVVYISTSRWEGPAIRYYSAA